jgi:hypothetical protein
LHASCDGVRGYILAVIEWGCMTAAMEHSCMQLP